MQLGIDGRKIPLARERGALASLEHAAELGMDGVFFRTVLEMSDTLDPTALSAIRNRADELGLYLETGLGKVNPFALPETPEVRDIGDGDTLLGFRRMIEACAAIGCRELWVGTANYKPALPGRYACDRFRTDVTWTMQLDATERFLGRLAPIARDLGVHINLETHEEITSWEVVRLVETLGPDAFGIVYDTSNGLQRGENPAETVRRVVPYVRQTHFKDLALFESDGGLVGQARTCGEGVIDFKTILEVLATHNPDLTITLECQEVVTNPRPPVQHTIEIFDPTWLAAHPDLTLAERDQVADLARSYAVRATQDPRLARQDQVALDYPSAVAAIQRSAAHLRNFAHFAPRLVDAAKPLQSQIAGS